MFFTMFIEELDHQHDLMMKKSGETETDLCGLPDSPPNCYRLVNP